MNRVQERPLGTSVFAWESSLASNQILADRTATLSARISSSLGRNESTQTSRPLGRSCRRRPRLSKRVRFRYQGDRASGLRGISHTEPPRVDLPAISLARWSRQQSGCPASGGECGYPVVSGEHSHARLLWSRHESCALDRSRGHDAIWHPPLGRSACPGRAPSAAGSIAPAGWRCAIDSRRACKIAGREDSFQEMNPPGTRSSRGFPRKTWLVSIIPFSDRKWRPSLSRAGR